MLNSLSIEGFRCFESFRLRNLGRINLLVGRNNSGKTSVLEAIQLLTSDTPLKALRDSLLSRGEYMLSEERGRRRDPRDLDIKHLFAGHTLCEGSSFSLSAETAQGTNKIAMKIEETDWPAKQDHPLYPSVNGDSEDLPGILLSIRLGNNPDEVLKIPLSSEYGLPITYVDRLRKDPKNLEYRTRFVPSSSLTRENMIELFDEVVLQPEEAFIIEALQAIEPNIERIAAFGVDNFPARATRGGFVVRLKGNEQRIPIGSMGDGIWRMLGLTLAIVNARNGYLLIDEIDTGLHFTAMANLWNLLWHASNRLNVQVFATTHSSDCWKSLETISDQSLPTDNSVTIHRIERNAAESIVFTKNQISIAAENDIEVR
jgi:predicted ATPase